MDHCIINLKLFSSSFLTPTSYYTQKNKYTFEKQSKYLIISYYCIISNVSLSINLLCFIFIEHASASNAYDTIENIY